MAAPIEPVAARLTQRREALKQAAINEQPITALLDETLRSADRTGTAEEGEIQAHGQLFTAAKLPVWPRG